LLTFDRICAALGKNLLRHRLSAFVKRGFAVGS